MILNWFTVERLVKKLISVVEVWVKGEKSLPVGNFVRCISFYHYLYLDLNYGGGETEGPCQQSGWRLCVSPWWLLWKTIVWAGIRRWTNLWVRSCVEDYNSFSIRWDLDQQITYDHKFGMVRLEDINTPLQQQFSTTTPSVDTTADQQQPSFVDTTAGQQQPSSSKTAVQSHANIQENLSEPSPDCGWWRWDEVQVMKATMYWTHPGVLVHNVPLSPKHTRGFS